MLKRSILDTIGGTPLVELSKLNPKASVHLFAKLEGQNPSGSVKDRIAKYMIEEAEAKGELTPDKVILEATSGNTGIALAMIGRRKGYRVVAVMPENVSQERCQLLGVYGAEIVFTDGAQGTNGAIEVARRMAQDPRYYMPNQFENPANPLAHYETTGPEILNDLPQIDVFVAGIGTGGTVTGAGRYLKERRPGVKIFGVEPHPSEQIQGLRSLEAGFVPPILDQSVLDGRMAVRGKDAFLALRQLLTKEGIFVGMSSGAVIHCALRLAQQMESGNIVALLADGGWKYLSSELWKMSEMELEEGLEGRTWW